MMAIGMKSPQWAVGKMGPLKLIALLEMGSQAYGFGKAFGNFGMGLQDGWSQEDTWNLVPLVFGGMSVAGIGKALAAAKSTSRAGRAGNAATGSTVAADDAVRNAGNTPTFTGTGCFVAGTEILTTEGIKNIEDIREGDWVIADDPTTPGQIERRQVLTAYEREAKTLIDIYVDGEIISATEEHPFWVVDKGWVEPKDLQVGDLLQTEDGRVVGVDKVEKREGDFKVYNFRVDGIPTYFVSELGILVHNNTNCPDNLDGSQFDPPTEPYNRRKHYGNTPTAADRKAVGGSPDHDPPLVQRYYEGDPATGEPPGYTMTPDERKASAKDRSRMRPATREEQNQQGAEMANYSKKKKKEYGL
jgi:hypothetical protein